MLSSFWFHVIQLFEMLSGVVFNILSTIFLLWEDVLYKSDFFSNAYSQDIYVWDLFLISKWHLIIDDYKLHFHPPNNNLFIHLKWKILSCWHYDSLYKKLSFPLFILSKCECQARFSSTISLEFVSTDSLVAAVSPWFHVMRLAPLLDSNSFSSSSLQPIPKPITTSSCLKS